MRLADAAGLDRLVAGHVSVAGPQAASTPLKIGCLVTGMLLGADSIDDMNVLRDCGLHHGLAAVRAPSTLGSFLRVPPRQRPPAGCGAPAAAGRPRSEEHTSELQS